MPRGRFEPTFPVFELSETLCDLARVASGIGSV